MGRKPKPELFNKRPLVINLLQTTDLHPREIAREVGVSVPHVERLEHSLDIRSHVTRQEIAQEWQTTKSLERRKQRRAVQPDHQIINKMISENMPLIVGSLKKYFSKHRVLYRFYNFRELVSDFTMHLRDNLPFYDGSKSSLPTFLHYQTMGFMSTRVRQDTRPLREKKKGSAQKSIPKGLPRGWAKISNNSRSIIKSLGLPLTTFIELGEEETKVALHQLSHTSGVQGPQAVILASIIEGDLPADIATKHRITVKTVSMHKMQALRLISEYLTRARSRK